MLACVGFHLDNNEVPVVYLDCIGVIVGGDGEIRFRVFDSEGDSLSYRYRYRFDYRVLDEVGDPVVLEVEYSLDGERWIRASVVGDSLLSDSTRYKGSKTGFYATNHH